jgi:hypothetical protein
MTSTPPFSSEHPIRAMLFQGKHPFPQDIEDMLRRLQTKPGTITTELAMDAFDWERGERLDSGRKKLQMLCKTHGV